MPELLDSIRDMIRSEFLAINNRMEDHEVRISAAEMWRQREEGFREGAGSIHAEVKEMREQQEKLEADLLEMRTQVQTVGKGVPWVLAVVGGGTGIIGALVQLILWLSTR